MTKSIEPPAPRIAQLGYTYLQDLGDVPLVPPSTPFLHPMIRTIDALVEATAASIARIRKGIAEKRTERRGETLGFMVSGALIETIDKPTANPLFPRFDFLAGCSNQLERDRARQRGIPDSRVVLSGPAKFWPEGGSPCSAHAIFCDSYEEIDVILERGLRGEITAEYLGASLRFPESGSRLGIAIPRPHGLDRLCERLSQFPADQKLGLEFQADSARIGIDRWTHLAGIFLQVAGQISAQIKRPIACVSMKGNWYADDWIFALDGPIAELLHLIAEQLPDVSGVIVDAGRALSQPSRSLLTRVLEVRRDPVVEVVVDASIAELPDVEHFPHRVAWRSSRDFTWRSLWPGDASILGRLGLDADILARRLEIPSELRAGDLLAFCDAGDSLITTHFPS